jgi:hypothetical protein
MSSGVPERSDDQLFELLPAVFRLRDSENGHPLRELLRAISGQVGEFLAEIGQLNDNWFIETCDDDLVPYFAGLVGLSLGASLGASPVAASARGNAVWRRREVANAISDRRRKGSFSVLEQLALDATGWPARAVEVGALAMVTQSLRFTDVVDRRLPDTAEVEALEQLGTPMSVAAPLTDVRRLGSHRTPGTFAHNGVAVWLWRLVAERVTRAPAATVEEEGNYTFDQLGRKLALAVVPAPRAAAAPPASDLDVATEISRRALELRLEDYYGPARSICLYRGREPVPRAEVLVADLTHWGALTPVGYVSIDPLLGRIAFPARHAPEEEVSVSYARLGIGAIGGGHYQRRLEPSAGALYRVGAHTVGLYRSLGGALKAWRDAKKQGAVPAAVIEITDDGVYEENIEFKLADGEHLEIRAAQGCRPVVIPVAASSGRPDRMSVEGPAKASAEHPPTFVLDGLWIARHSLDLRGRFSGVKLRHCTLVPEGESSAHEAAEHRRGPSLVVRAMPCPISIASSVIGRVVVESPEAGFDPISLSVSDSVIEGEGFAIRSDEDQPAWVNLSLVRVTMLGGARVHGVGLIEDSIVSGPLDCERRQTGAVRFSYICPGSRTPQRTGCQPDDALAALDAQVALGRVAAADRPRLAALERARVEPRFDGTGFGQPAYARLATEAAVELTRGAHDEGELGAYHDLWQSLLVADLQTRLDEFSPAGTDIDIRFAT